MDAEFGEALAFVVVGCREATEGCSTNADEADVIRRKPSVWTVIIDDEKAPNRVKRVSNKGAQNKQDLLCATIHRTTVSARSRLWLIGIGMLVFSVCC